LRIFKQFYDTAQAMDAIVHVIGKEYFLAREENYHKLYLPQYDQTSDLYQKYTLTKIIDNLLYRQNQFFHDKGYISADSYVNPNRDVFYHRISNELSALK